MWFLCLEKCKWVGNMLREEGDDISVGMMHLSFFLSFFLPVLNIFPCGCFFKERYLVFSVFLCGC